MMMIYRIWWRGRILRVRLSKERPGVGGRREGEKATRYVQAKVAWMDGWMDGKQASKRG